MLRPLACLKDDPPVMVADFIDSSSAVWRTDRLQEFFIRMDVDAILVIPLSTRRLNDCWMWHYEKNDLLSVRSVYRLLVQTKRQREDWLEGRTAGSNTVAEGRNWQRLWKTMVPSKVRVPLASRATLSAISGRQAPPEYITLLCLFNLWS
jgi:hypothetical protein